MSAEQVVKHPLFARVYSRLRRPVDRPHGR